MSAIDDFAEVQVAILGGGPAGAAAALVLARDGLTVALFDEAANRDDCHDNWKIGEGLPPVARRILQHLDLWETFVASGHLPSYGNCAAWGSAQLHEHNFLFDPHGHGWHLERQRFDGMLRDAALAAGARDCTGQRVGQSQHITDGWELTTADGGVRARCVIDATGRASWFARQQGALRQPADALVGVVALLTPTAETADQDSLTWIEAVENGWWYAALLPDGHLVAAYLSDGDLPPTKAARTAARTPESWLRLLEQTEHLAQRVARYGYQLEREPRIVSANSSRLTSVIGADWLAAGDAALAYDPLSSQGILAALETGTQAAQTVRAHLNGQPDALESYAQQLEERWAHYTANLSFYYGQERRWPHSPFWQRRRS